MKTRKKSTDELLEEISKKLDKLIAVSSIQVKDMGQNQKMKILNDMGLQPKEIATIIGTTPNTVSVELSKMKKNKTK